MTAQLHPNLGSLSRTSFLLFFAIWISWVFSKIFNFWVLYFLITSIYLSSHILLQVAKGNEAASSTLCLEISWDKYLSLSLTSSTLHKTLEYNTSSLPLYNKVPSLQFPITCSFSSEISSEAALMYVYQHSVFDTCIYLLRYVYHDSTFFYSSLLSEPSPELPLTSIFLPTISLRQTRFFLACISKLFPFPSSKFLDTDYNSTPLLSTKRFTGVDITK